MSEIRAEIERLEHGQTTYSAIEKLALLYAVRDHADQKPAVREYSSAAAEPSSEFLQAVSGAQIERVLQILDEHMTAVKALYPREYAAVLRRIKNKDES